MTNILVIFKREFRGYFSTPIAYVFMGVFVALAGVFTMYIGGFFIRAQADLGSFFGFHPWLYLFLIPALSMRLWAEERRAGTIELLLTLPITMPQAVLGKFLAAWLFTAIALALTFPVWVTVNFLGDPDNGIIVAGYLGSLLMAGAYLAIGSCISALTRNQVIAFVVTAVVCLLFVLSGYPLVLDVFGTWAPAYLVETVSSFSFLGHFEDIIRGVIDLRDVVYFTSLIALWLFVNVLALEANKAR